MPGQLWNSEKGIHINCTWKLCDFLVIFGVPYLRMQKWMMDIFEIKKKSQAIGIVLLLMTSRPMNVGTALCQADRVLHVPSLRSLVFEIFNLEKVFFYYFLFFEKLVIQC